jgi:GNAT superfamily N-acetyltransferase
VQAVHVRRFEGDFAAAARGSLPIAGWTGQAHPMTDVLRLADGDDLQAVEAVVRAAYAPYVERIGRDPGPMLDDYAALIASGWVRVIEEDGEILGVIVLIPKEKSLLLDNVALSPGAQGRGFGRELLLFAESHARGLDYGSITLYTNEAMTENISLYSRNGYVETHRAQEHGLRRVYMQKLLV